MSIEIQRDKIFNETLKARFQDKTLNRKDLEFIFDRYDHYFFKGEIRQKLLEDGSDLYFSVKKRKSGAVMICGRDSPNKYFINLAPNLFYKSHLDLKDLEPKSPSPKGTHMLRFLLFIFEHSIIHLLMMLFGFLAKDETKLFSKFGPLFECVLKEYFGYQSQSQNLGILVNISKSFYPRKGFSYHSNSCYMDSLLMILFETTSNFWRNILLKIDPHPTKLFCRDMSIDKTQKQALKIQEQLRIDYNNLHTAEGTSVKCSSLRTLLQECTRALKDKHGNWKMFNVGNIYGILTDFFPLLKMLIPTQIMRHVGDGHYLPDNVIYRNDRPLTFWDFMDPMTDIEKNHDYQIIKWDAIDFPILVFTNGGSPRVKIMNEKGREHGYVYIEGQKNYYDVIKHRHFGNYIIDDRYRLIGAIILHGTSPTRESGSHYTSYFLNNETWYEYNDVGAQINELDQIPETIWLEKNGNMPSMYFYKRIKGLERVEKEKIVRLDNLQYKKIPRNDGHNLYFVTPSNEATLDKLNHFEPKPLTKLENLNKTVLYWRIPEEDSKQFEHSLL